MSNIETQANALGNKKDIAGLQKLQDRKGITPKQFEYIQDVIDSIYH